MNESLPRINAQSIRALPHPLRQGIGHTLGSVFDRPAVEASRALAFDGQQPKPMVFVVDDDISIRESFEVAIRREGWQVETCGSAREFLERARSAEVGCVVLDTSLPDLNGLELQEQLTNQQRSLSIIFMSAHDDVPTTVRAMKAGAMEFLTKPVNKIVLLAAVRDAVHRSRRAFEARQTLEMLRTNFCSLTERERAVMILVVVGLLNKQVGGKLGISEITVKAHRGQVMRKMKARSFAELVIMGFRLGVSESFSPFVSWTDLGVIASGKLNSQ